MIMNTKHNTIITALTCIALGFISCENNPEPIKVITPKREINTSLLKEYKKNIDQRNIAIGAIYNWGVKNESNLMQTPDSLDIIIVKDNYLTINEQQKQDLQQVQKIKFTKVLIGADLNSSLEMLKEEQRMITQKRLKEKEKEFILSGDVLTAVKKDEIINEILTVSNEELQEKTNTFFKMLAQKAVSSLKENAFDGMSIELPERYENDLDQEVCTHFIENVTPTLNGKILIIENPKSNPENEKANWLVVRKKAENNTLAFYEDWASQFPNKKLLASVDFSSEDIDKGFSDSSIFLKEGKLSKIIDITHWKASNKGGVLFYHIEKNYTNIKGNNTYVALKNAINQLQSNP